MKKERVDKINRSDKITSYQMKVSYSRYQQEETYGPFEDKNSEEISHALDIEYNNLFDEICVGDWENAKENIINTAAILEGLYLALEENGSIQIEPDKIKKDKGL